MIAKSKNSSRRGRRRNGGGSRRLNHIKFSNRPEPPCAICEKPIKDITSAIAPQSTDGSAVHFDCALKSVQQKIKPKEGELVIYLGKGGFAVVDAEMYKKKRLKVLRREEWEYTENVIPWRKEIRCKVL